MSDVNITYETLYEILRNEKSREDIQELSPSFYEDVVAYLKKNKQMLDEAIQSNSSDEEKEDIIRQIKNIKSMVKEIYERRETKIINLARNKSRTNSDSLEADTILVQEMELYERMVELMNCFRGNILTRSLNGKIPIANESTCSVEYDEEESTLNSTTGTAVSSSAKESKITNHGKGIDKEEAKKENKLSESTVEKEKSKPFATSIKVGISSDSEHEKNEKKTLKFRDHVPKFLGKELEVYGPFDKEDIANLPKELANILIRKGKAEEVME